MGENLWQLFMQGLRSRISRELQILNTKTSYMTTGQRIKQFFYFFKKGSISLAIREMHTETTFKILCHPSGMIAMKETHTCTHVHMHTSAHRVTCIYQHRHCSFNGACYEHPSVLVLSWSCPQSCMELWCLTVGSIIMGILFGWTPRRCAAFCSHSHTVEKILGL